MTLLSVRRFKHLSIRDPSICTSVHASVHPWPVHLYVGPCICPSGTCLSICPCIHRSICPSVHRSVHPGFVYSSAIHQSTYSISEVPCACPTARLMFMIYYMVFYCSYNNVTGDWYVSDKQQLEDVRRASIAVSITMIAGLIQLLMRVLRLGILTSYMSLPFVSSFTTGCALHIMLNQLPFQLGFPVERLSGVFQLPVLIYRIASNIGRTNPSALVTSLICTVFLVGMKEGVNEKFRKKLPVPVPAELILVIVATTISHFACLDQLFQLKIIGKIPTGIPAPRIPSMAGAQDLIVDGVIIAVIGFAMAITMAKLMSDRHEYEIDSNQELLAYGITNTVSSMFGCFMSTQAPPRTMVQEATGCKTQLAGFISTILPFFVALFMGPLFTSLPVSVLGTICSCALLPLMKQFKEIPGLWRVNRTDAFVWLVTFICTVLLNVPCGLIIGIAVSLFAVIIQAQLASGHRLSQAGQTEIFCEIPANTGLKPEIDFCVFRFDSSLFFANVDSFKCQLFTSTFNPVEEKKSASVVKAPVQETVANDTPRIVENGVTGKIDLTINDVNENRYISTDLWKSEKITFESGYAIKPRTNEGEFKNGDTLRGHGNKETGPVKEMEGEGVIPGSRSRRVIVLDCSRITYIDVMGLSTLRQVMTLYRSVGSHFVLANCSCDMVERMRRFDLIADTSDIEGKLGEHGVVEGKHILVYPTVLDACVASQNI